MHWYLTSRNSRILQLILNFGRCRTSLLPQRFRLTLNIFPVKQFIRVFTTKHINFDTYKCFTATCRLPTLSVATFIFTIVIYLNWLNKTGLAGILLNTRPIVYIMLQSSYVINSTIIVMVILFARSRHKPRIVYEGCFSATSNVQ